MSELHDKWRTYLTEQGAINASVLTVEELRELYWDYHIPLQELPTEDILKSTEIAKKAGYAPNSRLEGMLKLWSDTLLERSSWERRN